MCLVVAGTVAQVSIAAPNPAAKTPVIPVILLDEPFSSPNVWESSGFIKRVSAAGLIEDVNLFVITPDEGYKDFASASQSVAALVNCVIRQAESPTVDVVAYGVSGLIFRYAIEWGYVDTQCVRNLVMVGTPNRGTFVAELLKSLSTIVEQESMLEESTRSARFIPLASGPTDTMAVENVSLQAPNMLWKSESSWICERAETLYEPLYALYVAARHLAIPYVPAQSPKETFAGWIYGTYPQLWLKAVTNGTDPPVFKGISTIPGSGQMPSPGEDLSSGYYEILAMEAAKNLYVMRKASKGNLVECLLKDLYLPSGIKDAVVHYGQRMISYYAGKALITVKSQAQNALADKIVTSLGFQDGADTPLLRRLIKEETIVNLGSSLQARFCRVSANRFLADINKFSLSQSMDRVTRYVTVAGSAANLWSLGWPQIGPNDFYCEVDTAIPPIGPKDIVKVFTGVFGTSHSGLLASKEVQEYLVSHLTTDWQCLRTTGSAIKVSSWEPAYLQVSSGTVEFELPQAPAGWAYAIWVEADNRSQVVTPSYVGGKAPVVFTVDHPSEIGVRFVRSDDLNPISKGSKVNSAFAKEISGQIKTRFTPGRNNPAANPNVQEEISHGSGPNDSGNWGNMDPPIVLGDDWEPSDLPLVRVVYRNKQTTLKQPKQAYHDMWTIDFGDGQKQIIQGQPSLTLQHEYKKPGIYRASISSYDNDGKHIFTKVWDAKITDADKTWLFQCSSIAQQTASLVIQGPKKWVTGKPAEFRVSLTMDILPGVKVVSVVYDPGESFLVLWERAGDFEVSCAATVELEYMVEDKAVTVKNTYIETVPVIVLTTGVVE